MKALDLLGRHPGLWGRHDGKGRTTAARVVVLEGITSSPRDLLLVQAEPLLALPVGVVSRAEEGVSKKAWLARLESRQAEAVRTFNS